MVNTIINCTSGHYGIISRGGEAMGIYVCIMLRIVWVKSKSGKGLQAELATVPWHCWCHWHCAVLFISMTKSKLPLPVAMPCQTTTQPELIPTRPPHQPAGPSDQLRAMPRPHAIHWLAGLLGSRACGVTLPVKAMIVAIAIPLSASPGSCSMRTTPRPSPPTSASLLSSNPFRAWPCESHCQPCRGLPCETPPGVSQVWPCRSVGTLTRCRRQQVTWLPLTLPMLMVLVLVGLSSYLLSQSQTFFSCFFLVLHAGSS